MKKSISKLAVFMFVILGLLFTSCVSTKKFRVSEAKVEKLQKDSISSRKQLNDCNSMLSNYKEVNETSQSKLKALLDEKTSLENEIAQKKTELNKLSKESNLTIADREAKLKKLQDVIQSEKEAMSRLKNTITNALLKYKNDELTVYIKDGNVYISLAEKMLFKSGSDEVDNKGKEALKSFAEVLNSTEDISVLIEGNTDNVPINTVRHKDNWDLSANRATAVVRILTKDYGCDATRITASGRGEFNPVKTNETVEGRAGNRRIDIILSPDLKELFKVLEQ